MGLEPLARVTARPSLFALAAPMSAVITAGASSWVVQAAILVSIALKPRTSNERLICSDERFSELDQAVSIAYSQLGPKPAKKLYQRQSKVFLPGASFSRNANISLRRSFFRRTASSAVF